MRNSPNSNQNIPLWESYHHPVVRDIAWILTTPPLLAASLHSSIAPALPCLATLNTDTARQWLNTLENNPTLLGELNRSNYRRLGLYCEALVAFIFKQPQAFHNYHLRAKNLQITKEGRTLGELDFIFSDDNGQYAHLEMAVKYYLFDALTPGATTKGPENEIQVSVATSADQFIGPNRKDRLDIKINRMRDHQLPIVRSPEAQVALKDKNIEVEHEALLSYLYLTGKVFFNPFQALSTAENSPNTPTCYSTSDEPPKPHLLNAKQHTGHWVHINQFTRYVQSIEPNTKWKVLRKLNWLAGPEASVTLYEEALTQEEIHERIEQGDSLDFTPPILLQPLTADKTPHTGTHKAKISKRMQVMLVDNRWPHHLK